MTKTDIQRIIDILIGQKRIRNARTVKCHEAREKYKSGAITKRELDNLIDRTLQEYFDSDEFRKYQELKHQANEDPEVDSTVSQIHDELWKLIIPRTSEPNTFQLSWDTKDSDRYRSEELRFEIVEMILTENIDNDIHQPTESTIIFESDKNFEYWQLELNNMLKKMYFTFCQIDADALLLVEENDTLDLPTLIIEVQDKLRALDRLRKIVYDGISDGLKN